MTGTGIASQHKFHSSWQSRPVVGHIDSGHLPGRCNSWSYLRWLCSSQEAGSSFLAPAASAVGRPSDSRACSVGSLPLDLPPLLLAPAQNLSSTPFRFLFLSTSSSLSLIVHPLIAFSCISCQPITHSRLTTTLICTIDFPVSHHSPSPFHHRPRYF